jgi:hypothetical protein
MADVRRASLATGLVCATLVISSCSAGRSGLVRTTPTTSAVGAANLGGGDLSGGGDDGTVVAVPKPPGPGFTSVFDRMTSDGVHIRAWQSGAANAGDCPGGPSLTAYYDYHGATGELYGVVPSPRQFPPPQPILEVLHANTAGYPTNPSEGVLVHSASPVTKVQVRFPDGAVDEMSPVEGWSVLAHGGTVASSEEVRAFDALGRSLGQVSDAHSGAFGACPYTAGPPKMPGQTSIPGVPPVILPRPQG